MTIKDLGDLVIYAGTVAGALTAIGWLLYRVAVRPSVRWLKTELTTTREATQAVQAEVTPNHGTSMKDQMGRIEVKVDRLRSDFADHLSNHPGS